MFSPVKFLYGFIYSNCERKVGECANMWLLPHLNLTTCLRPNTLAGVKLGVCISPYSTPTLTHIDSTIDIIYDSTIHESRNIKYIKTLRKK